MVTNEACLAAVSVSMQERYGDIRNAAKKAARSRGWTTKSFMNWLYGKNAPRMQDLIVLMADCPKLHAEIDRMVEETRQCLQQSKL
ncbi:hypothetical protein NFI95_15700 [Acetobacteraceae bacterium KSS8]|uniref:XRE family transcriptional regulator n=1 Tax=Endosaccharibacter trunci TaxID=2812733 RepID=A0ABT1WAH9_9PROT|nr:hypothetical protein [Acetobacteraceae bacterium KSS8]